VPQPSTRRTPFGRRRSRDTQPRSHPRPFGQHHPSERQRTTAAMAAATATPPSPQAAAMRQPSDTRPSAADTRPDWPPGSRPRKWSTTEGPVSVDRRSSPGVRGKAALVRPGGRRCRSCRTPPASGRSCGHDSPPHGPTRTAWFLLPERRTVNPPIAPTLYNFLYSSSRPALRAAFGGRPRPGALAVDGCRLQSAVEPV
jgi:hypothetical protein